MANKKPREVSQLRQIADKYGISVKTVNRRIMERPELGIVIEPGKTVKLDDAQMQGLCAYLDACYPNSTPTKPTQDNNLDTSVDTVQVSKKMWERVQVLEAELEKMKAELAAEKAHSAQLNTDLSVERARSEERQGFIEILQGQAAQVPQLMAAASEQAERVKELESEVSRSKEEWKQKKFMDRLLRR